MSFGHVALSGAAVQAIPPEQAPVKEVKIVPEVVAVKVVTVKVGGLLRELTVEQKVVFDARMKVGYTRCDALEQFLKHSVEVSGAIYRLTAVEYEGYTNQLAVVSQSSCRPENDEMRREALNLVVPNLVYLAGS
jgi:hypothetical protein